MEGVEEKGKGKVKEWAQIRFGWVQELLTKWTKVILIALGGAAVGLVALSTGWPVFHISIRRLCKQKREVGAEQFHFLLKAENEI